MPPNVDHLVKRDMTKAIAEQIMHHYPIEKESSVRGGDHYRLVVHTYSDDVMFEVIPRLKEMNQSLFNPDLREIIDILSK